MKTTLVVDGSKYQIVLTPENDMDKVIIKIFDVETNEYRELNERKPSNALITIGRFYECYGGWIREGGGENEKSLIVIIDKK